MDIYNWLSVASAVISISTMAWVYWFNTTHWPGNGFVRVPRELRNERIRKAHTEASMGDRTVAPATTDHVATQEGSHVRTARMRGRRMQ